MGSPGFRKAAAWVFSGVAVLGALALAAGADRSVRPAQTTVEVGSIGLRGPLIGLSIDSNFNHIAWLRTSQEKIRYKGI